MIILYEYKFDSYKFINFYDTIINFRISLRLTFYMMINLFDAPFNFVIWFHKFYKFVLIRISFYDWVLRFEKFFSFCIAFDKFAGLSNDKSYDGYKNWCCSFNRVKFSPWMNKSVRERPKSWQESVVERVHFISADERHSKKWRSLTPFCRSKRGSCPSFRPLISSNPL